MQGTQNKNKIIKMINKLQVWKNVSVRFNMAILNLTG